MRHPPPTDGANVVLASKLVEDCIREDLVLQEALSREIINYRAAARWLINTHDLEASNDAILSVLRRNGPAKSQDAFEGARSALKGSHVNTKSHVCCLQVRNEPEVQESIPSLFKAVDFVGGDTLRISSSAKGFSFVVDQANIERVVDLLGERNVEEVRRDLTEIILNVPVPASWETPGILALVCSTLALQGISIVSVVNSRYEDIVLVDDTDAFEAYRVLAKLTDGEITVD